MGNKQTSLKLLINKNTQPHQVVFAESDKDFVDILLSFLTLPMGTIIKLLAKESTVGCMDTLYGSVENLDPRYLKTDACKSMLLRPRNAAEDWCKCLALNIDDSVYDCYFICSAWNCVIEGNSGRISSVKNVDCRCGKKLDRSISLPLSKKIGEGKGVFVRGTGKYMITDDLQVMPASVENTLLFLKNYGVRDETTLGQKMVNMGAKEILHLLKCALLSKTALTDAFLLERDVGVGKLDSIEISESQPSIGTIKLKLVVRKSDNKVLCAEAQENFMDLLFSFLTFPLGSIIKLFGGNSGMGSVDHLYKSVFNLSGSRHLRSKECAAMLLSPMLPPFFGCDNQLLGIIEMKAGDHCIPRCSLCVNTTSKKCLHGLGIAWLVKKDPKSERNTTSGGGFVKGPAAFMVTDELAVKVLSPASFLSGLKVPISDLDEQVVCIGKTEALNLLKASLLSKTALSLAFAKSLSPEKKAGAS